MELFGKATRFDSVPEPPVRRSARSWRQRWPILPWYRRVVLVLLALIAFLSAGEVVLRTIGPEQSSKAMPSGATCGAPANPYRLNLCGRGYLVMTPPPQTCRHFRCLPDFRWPDGYMARCLDGTYTMSGGLAYACAGNGGEEIAVYQG